MKERPYRDRSDVDLLRDFNARAIRASGGCGYLHPGDNTHHFFGGNKLFDPAELATIWEDDDGVAAWTLVEPRYRGFDLQVRPDLRGGDLERHAVGFAERRLLESMRRHGVQSDRIEVDACRCDTDRSRLLLELGWSRGGEAEYVLNRRPLKDVPEPAVPNGYRIRPVGGIDEAGRVAELHVAVFKRSGWTEELYRRYMQSPGYLPEREYVAEASDGSLAAFTVTWHDEVNRTGLFEPVRTHPDRRGTGLARALLDTEMDRMAAAGIKMVLVQNEGGNEASRNLYLGCGFEPCQVEDGYYKVVA